MLYGIATPLARRILERGYRVRLAVPFGKYWFPYLMRRLAERPANLAFFLKGALHAMKGIWSAVLTPVDARLTPDRASGSLLRPILQSGCDGITVLGTTGEAMSFSAAQRGASWKRSPQRDAEGSNHGGNRCRILGDAVALTRAAFAWDFPPHSSCRRFFIATPPTTASSAFFDALFARVRRRRG